MVTFLSYLFHIDSGFARNFNTVVHDGFFFTLKVKLTGQIL